jgi:hypothetical protein
MPSLTMILGAVSAGIYGWMFWILFTAVPGAAPFYTLDTDVGWTVANARDRLAARSSPAGVGAHLRLNAVDTVFPLLGYGPFLYLALRGGPCARWAWLAVVAAACDVVENYVVRGILSAAVAGVAGPAPADATTLWGHGHVATWAKFGFLGAALVMLAVGKLSSSPKRD